MTQIIERTETEIVDVPVTELLHLKDTTFVLPKYAMRELDPAHVIKLSETDASKWPAAQAVETDEGPVVIDGYHRQAALTRQVKLKFLGLEEKSVNVQNKALEAPLDDSTQKALNALLDTTILPVELGVYADEKAVAKAALTANLQHGLAPKDSARVYIALDLYKLTRGEVPEPSQAEIARMVGISRATLNEYLKKEEKAAAEAPEEGTAQEGAEAELDPAQEIEKAIQKARKAAEKYIANLAALYEEYPQAYTEAIRVLFPTVVDGMSNIYVADNDKLYTADVTRILSTQEDFNTGNIPHIARLGKTLAAAAKSLEKTHGILPVPADKA